MKNTSASLLTLCLLLTVSSACTQTSTKLNADPAVTASAVHTQALVLDAHADVLMPGVARMYVAADGSSKVSPDKLQAGGVDAVVMSIAVGPGPRNAEGDAQARVIADQKLAAITALAEAPENNMVIARSADELVTAHKNGKTALIMGFLNARIIGTELSGLDDFYTAGVRVFALTHLGHNNFADSSRPLFLAESGKHEPDEHGGLSALGRQAIQRVNSLGGIVDVSQLSRAATLQVLSLSSAPVIASHSNVWALSKASRNLSDEEIDGIGKIGGVIHIAPFLGYLFDSSDKDLDRDIRTVRREAGIAEDYYYPFELYWEIDDPAVKKAFLGKVLNLLGPGTVDSMIDHIDYIVKRIGIDHVGIGTDFNHGSGIQGFDDASEALNVTKALLARGYKPQDIEKIWSGNFLRVMREADTKKTSPTQTKN